MADQSEQSKRVEELDPELIKLPRSKTRIRPIMALAVIGICLTIVLRLVGDLRFSEAQEPILAQSVEALAEMQSDQRVQISLRPDWPQALRIVPSRSTSGKVLVPTLGTGGSVWLLLAPTAWQADSSTDNVFQGRLSRLEDMEFLDALKRHVAGGTVAMRPILLAKVAAALRSSSLLVADVSGDRYQLEPSTPVLIEQVSLDRVQIVAVSTDPYRDQASWSLALRSAGILSNGMEPVTSTPTSWTYQVQAPQGVAGVREALRVSKLFAATASQIKMTRTGTWSQLSMDGDDVVFGKAMPGFRIQSLSVAAPPRITDGALLIDTTETPERYWYVLLLVLALGGFAAIFGAAIVAHLRRE